VTLECIPVDLGCVVLLGVMGKTLVVGDIDWSHVEMTRDRSCTTRVFVSWISPDYHKCGEKTPEDLWLNFVTPRIYVSHPVTTGPPSQLLCFDREVERVELQRK
jgi:hypothetical protein